MQSAVQLYMHEPSKKYVDFFTLLSFNYSLVYTSPGRSEGGKEVVRKVERVGRGVPDKISQHNDECMELTIARMGFT